MLIHVDDPLTLQGARSTKQPLTVTYGIHSEYELAFVAGLSNTPVDLQSFNCSTWTVTIAPSPDSPTTVLAYAVFNDNIAQGNTLRFDLAATSVEMYKYCCGNPATPAVLEIKGFAVNETTPAASIRLAITIATTMQRRKPTDLSTALMEEIQLQASIAGATQQQVAQTLEEVRRISAGVDSEATSVAETVASAVEVRMQGYESTAVSAASDALSQATVASSAAALASAAASSADLNASHASGHAADAADRSSQAFLHEQNASSAMRSAQSAAASASTDMEAVSSALESATSQAELASTYKESAHADMAAASDAETAASQAESHASASEQHASASESNASKSESNASKSEAKASTSEQHASTSEQHASTSEQHASASESNASASEQHASASESNASASEQHASASESNASKSESNASKSASNAATSEQHASTSEQHASASESNAAASESNASKSEANASKSESNASKSATNASTSEQHASVSEQHASTSETNASASETAALGAAAAAALSMSNASASEQHASTSEQHASTSEQHASTSEQHASASESAASQSMLATAQYSAAVSAASASVAAMSSATQSNADAVSSNTGTTNDNVSSAASLLSSTEDAASAAGESDSAASSSARLAKSWAVGSTGVRDGEDTDNAKYYAGLSSQYSPEGKADKVQGEVDGHLAALDSTGNLTDSEIPADNVARQDGSYDTLHAGTAGNLVDDRAPSTNRKFGFDTACGDISISDDGTATPTLLKGTTYVKNQLVGDSKVIKETGQGVVNGPYSVSGDIDHAYIKGRSLVKNQLVPDDENFYLGTISGFTFSCTRDANYNFVISYANATSTAKYPFFNIPNNLNHILLCKSIVVSSTDTLPESLYINRTSGQLNFLNKTQVQTINSTGSTSVMLKCPANAYGTLTLSIQIVDLTMLYNGVSSLITPITDWDKLVSDTGMCGSYTAYDAGTVVHSDQTEVKVTGKNLFDVSYFAAHNDNTNIGITNDKITLTTYANNSHVTLASLLPGVKAGDTVTARVEFTLVSGNPSVSGVTSSIKLLDSNSSSVGTVIGPKTPNTFELGTKYVLSYTINVTDAMLAGFVTFYGGAAGSTSTFEKLQFELGSLATAYEPYYDGGTATAGLLKGVPGSVYDQLDAVTGNVTTRIGSYTFTGNENWQHTESGAFYNNSLITNAYRTAGSTTVLSYMMAGFTPTARVTQTSVDGSFSLNSAGQGTASNIFIIKDSSTTDTAVFAAKMAGKTVYYRLATYSKSTTTPQPLTQSTGNLTVLQTAGTLPVNLDVRHAVSEWDEPIVRNCKYIFRDNGVDSLVTGSTTVTYKHVVGGEHKLINLTQWFGRNREPSVDDFYKLFPTWKDADIPYDRGTILNYKGTGVRTIGFNAYNHATGTAVLLGGNKYQICGTYTSCTYTDQWGNAEELSIDAQGIFTPVNNGTLTVVGGNDTDTCVHLCWSGYKNYGEPDYEWFPYEEKGVEWDLSPWFPNGMNGIGDDQDLMQNNSATTSWGVAVFNGTEAWSSYDYMSGFYLYIDDMKSGNQHEGACNFLQVWTGNLTTLAAPSVRLGAENNVAYCCYVWDEGVIETVDDWKAYLASLYAAGTPLIIIYPLATPVTSEVAPTQNFSYPVNDFGTEQSLPVNTLTLLTTDLDADIRYSLDFTRTVAHYSEIENDVKQLVKEKDNLARQDGNYGDKGGVFNYATQLLDPNAPPTEASYGNRTAAGDVSIADNGTADVTSLQGTTQIQNQLVHDTNMNSKSSVDGKLVVTDAVGGQLSRLEIHGGCVVHNQLVKESVEKTAAGTGRLGCEDGVAGNAKSLVMTAPMSVVMNQLQSIEDNTSNDVIGTVSNNILSLSGTSSGGYYTARPSLTDNQNIVGHTYMLVANILTNPNNVSLRYGWLNRNPIYTSNTVTGIISVKVTLTQEMAEMGRSQGFTFPTGSNLTGITCWIGCVDLTQYFNGNTTLINSINTWDDLVAYDSSFASYVSYNTGTVQGVTPSVKVNHTTNVACPVELFGLSNTSNANLMSDEYDCVTGIITRNIKTYTFVGNEDITPYGDTYPGCFYWGGITDSARISGVYWSYAILDGYIARNIESTLTEWADQSIVINTTATAVNSFLIKDTSCTTKEQMLAKLTGKTLYYVAATPTTSTYSPTTIPTLDIYNTALQTAGTRPCGLSLAYDGKDQTIALNSSHTYVFNDNQEDDSVITGQSSIEAVGGEDQLVDITQLYNGDATKIANIHSWASLSTRFHRYRDFQPYNPGTVEPDTPVIRVFPNEHAYGIIYDPSQNLPACQWVELNNGVLTQVSSFSDFKETPCHELYRCVMSDLANRTIAYYLDDEDSDKKYNGTRNGVASDGSASVLTGADGDVETEMPIGYWDLDEDWQGTGKRLWLISDRPFMGSYYPAEIHDFFYVSPDGSTPRKQYVGSYRGCICDADGNPLNTTEGALAQVTGTASTNKVRSIKGALPYVNVSLNDFTVKSGRNGGSSVNVKYHQWLFLLMAIEQGSLDNQAISQGYSGGIQNAFCFWRKSGRVNAGNGTASITAVENTQDMDNFQRFTIGSTQVQRDTNADADGRYAWSIYNRTASSTRYFTNSPAPANGDVVYSASTGTTTAGTVASYTLQSNRVIQFQYRGIENPFGEVWEFEHGIQKFQTGSLRSFRGTDNLTYTRDLLSDGPSSYAWKNTSDTVLWTNTAAPGTSTTMYSDAALTTSVTTKYKDQPYYRYSSEGYWETLATSDYTMTAQRTAANPVYTVRHNHWPLSGWDSKFDPITFFMRKTGSPGASGRYLPDYWYNDGTVGDRVAIVGGYAYVGSYDGLGYRNLVYGLTNTNVYISGRPSA